MTTVGVRELKIKTSEVIRRVRDEGETFDVTYRGRVVARLSPIPEVRSNAEEQERIWAERLHLIEQIGARLPKGTSAVDAVREQRREL